MLASIQVSFHVQFPDDFADEIEIHRHFNSLIYIYLDFSSHNFSWSELKEMTHYKPCLPYRCLVLINMSMATKLW
jgi:hypothetical protein